MTYFETQLNQLALPERIAIEEKYKGLRYALIKNVILKETGQDIPEATILGWFKSDGKLFGVYQFFAEQNNQLREREARIGLGSLINNAVAVLSQAMLEKTVSKFTCPHCNQTSEVKLDIPTPTRLKAAIQILDRVLGKPNQIVEFENDLTVNTYPNLTTEELVEKIKETNKSIEELQKEEQRQHEEQNLKQHPN